VNIVALVSVVSVILGIVALALFFVKRYQRYRSWILAGALFLFAISIGIYLAGQPSQPDISTPEPLAANTPTSAREAEQPPTPPFSPISPISPVATTRSISIELDSMEAQFEGCLLFVSNRSGDFEIYRLSESIDDLRQLTHSPGLDIQPDWSPDGSKVVFASNREEGVDFQIYVMNADGSGQERLGVVQSGDNSHQTWSPDGSQIAFHSKRDTNADPSDDNFDIYRMNSDGSDIRPLTADSADDSEPVWSPGGERIAFISERDGKDEIYVMNSDGTDQTRLTDLPVLKSGLSWSEDGRSILFEGDGDIYILDAETRETLHVTQTKDVNETTPEWVGEDIIAFSSDRTGNWDLYLADITNPNEIRLARLTDDPGTDHSPTWFPCVAD
jgi:Tol biopolymer transport system component